MKRTAKLVLAGILCSTLMLVAAAAPQRAGASGITVYQDGEKFVKVGGRIQLQYHLTDPDAGTSSDKIFFRRLRPFIEGSVYRDWLGKFQWDMGKADGDNEIAVKDAFIRYTGFKNISYLKYLNNIEVTVGNADFPFSREKLTSSKKQQFVERTFVGDHNYGTPDRQLGLHVKGDYMDRLITYGVALAAADIDPDSDKLDFDTPVNRGSDFNEGWIFGGRLDYHPFGHLSFAQGDFKRNEMRAVIGVAAFVWDNDNDNNTNTVGGIDTSGGANPDVDGVAGFEISGAYRNFGFSVDGEYNFFHAETVDPYVTGGIYRSGSTDLQNLSVKGGYMVLPDKLELVVGFQIQDADNYSTEWTRTSFGANFFLRGHDIKAQATYRIGEDVDGVKGNDEDEFFVQAQYVF